MKYIIVDDLEKAGGPFIGPRGGKWADPDHKIPWKETGPERTKKVEVDGPKRTGKKNDEKTSRTAKEDDSKGGESQNGGKYTKRVPYTDKDGKKKYRYYYAESSVARDVQEGENVRIGKQFATVNKVNADGSMLVTVGKTKIKVKPDQWEKILSKHYGDAYFQWAEKRAQQSVNAVMKHVSKADLAELKGETDKERIEDLKKRVPNVYEKLKQSFSRAGVNPFRAKQVLSASLERKGWEPEARAAVIGNVITGRNQNYQTTIRAAENLAGGGTVKVGHVGAVTEIVKISKNEEKDEIAEVAAAAEKELAKLSALLAKVKGGDKGSAPEALAAALSSTAMQKLNLISKAFPGIADRAVGPTRKILEEVPSVAPRTEPKSDGSDTVVFVAGEGGNAKALNAKYKLVEANDAIASHDPSTFNKRSDYPAGIQERAYHRDKSEQEKVIRNAQRLRPEFVINTNPDAVNGAPIMGPDGVVLGGNSRTMSMQLAYAKHPEKAKEMRDYLMANAHQAGFTKEDVAQFKNPILVRVVSDGGKTKQDKQLLVRQMNESFTQAMDPRTMQVAMGRKLSDKTIEEIGKSMEADETLNAFLGSKRAESFIAALQKEGIIDQRNANQYFLKGTKKLNPDGQTLVARILVGRTIGDADLLSATKPSLVENLARAVPYMAQAKAYGENYDISEDVKTALDAYNSLQYRVDTGTIPSLNSDMTAERFNNLFAQQEMFGGAHPVTNNPRANALLEVLIRRPGATQITKVFKEYADQARQNPEGQTSMFGAPKSPNEIFKEVAANNLPKPKKESQGSLMMSDAKFVLFGYGDDFETLKKSWGRLFKSGGPFIGPRGGKWADEKHTIPWNDEKVVTSTKREEPSEKNPKRALPGTQLPPETLKKLLELKVSKLPQGDIHKDNVSVDLTGDVHSHAIISWKDIHGKIQQGYTDVFHEKNAKKKWARIVKFQGSVVELKKKVDHILSKQKDGTELHQGALVAGMIADSGLRPGNMSSVKNHDHYGLSTLKKKHVKVDRDTIHLEFVGKSGKTNKTEITNPVLASAMKFYVETKKDDEHLFNPDMAKKIAAEIVDKGMKLKDLRTIKASNTARELLREVAVPPPLTGDDKKDKRLLAKALVDVSAKIAGILNNTPAIARSSYIHPEIFKNWAIEVAGARPALLEV